MIKEWRFVQTIRNATPSVKELIRVNNYKAIDIGGAKGYWSFPECRFVADIVEPTEENCTFINIDISNKSTWTNLLDYVKNNGKFDYSICSHTLEDVINPTDLLMLLPKISKMGYLAVPSKYLEFSFTGFNHKYRGFAHHKQLFDVRDNKLRIYPKFSFIEVMDESDILVSKSLGQELVIFWEDDIPYSYFGEEYVAKCDEELITMYYDELLNY